MNSTTKTRIIQLLEKRKKLFHDKHLKKYGKRCLICGKQYLNMNKDAKRKYCKQCSELYSRGNHRIHKETNVALKNIGKKLKEVELQND